MAGDRPTPLSRIIRIAAAVEDGILVVLLTAMVILAASQIVMRLLGTGALWLDPALKVMVLWVGLIGAMVATRSDKQISVDALSGLLTPRWKAALRVATDVFTAAVATWVGWNAIQFVILEREFGMKAFGSVPAWVCELVLPLAFGIIALRYLLYAIRHLGKAMAGGGEA